MDAADKSQKSRGSDPAVKPVVKDHYGTASERRSSGSDKAGKSGWRRATRSEDKLQMQDEMSRLPIFAQCQEEFHKALTSRIRIKVFPKGQVVVEEGAPSSSLLIVRRGVVQVLIDGFQVDRIQHGKYFGETALLGMDKYWVATLQAENLCTIAELAREDFLDVIEGFPEVGRFFRNLTEASMVGLQDGTVVEPCELFADLSERTLLGIDRRALRRLYFPGERLQVQGDPVAELHILVRGQVSLHIGGRTVRSEVRGVELQEQPSLTTTRTTGSQLALVPHQKPVCFGEQGLLSSGCSASSTMKAVQVSHVRILHRPVFLKMLEEHNEHIHIEKLSSVLDDGSDGHATTSLHSLQEIGIFKQLGCSTEFLDFLAQSLEDRVFLCGQKIVQENTSDDSNMYILTRGTAQVMQGGVEVNCIESGAVFGEVVLFGMADKRTSTVVATSICQTKVLHQKVVIRGLETFPDERQKVLMIAFARQPGIEAPAAEEHRPRKASFCLGNVEDWKTVEFRIVMKAMKSSPLLGSMPEAFIEELSAVAINRIYMPGDLVMEEGQEGDSMFICVSGTAAVFAVSAEDKLAANHQGANHKPQLSKVGMLSAASISGELAMLGVYPTRSATIQAETICCMWEISHDCALAIVNRMADVRQFLVELIVQHLQHTVPTLIDALPLFRNFDRKFRMLLGLYCERHAFFPGQQIFAEGHPADGLYIVNLGRATLERKGITIKSYTSGSYFNSTIMLGINQCSLCSLKALQTCHVVVISRASFIQALEHYPSQQSYLKLVRSEYSAHEEFKQQIHKLCMRTTIWKRAMTVHQEGEKEPTPSVISGYPYARMTDAQRLKKSFRMWYKHAELCRTRRAACEKRRDHTDQWVVKKKEAVAKRKQKEQDKREANSPDRDPRSSSRREHSIERFCTPPSSKNQDASLADSAAKSGGLPPLQANVMSTPRCADDMPEGRTIGLEVSLSPPFSIKTCGSPIRLPKTVGRSAKVGTMLEARYSELSSIYSNWRLSSTRG
jgi:CRP-like cAMP-binding protein